MIPQRLTNIAFVVALTISVLLLVGGAVYLSVFLAITTSTLNTVFSKAAETPNTGVLSSAYALTSIAFNSCGMFVGIAFAFLGLAMSLLGVRGEMDASGQTEAFSFKILRASPGALAMICSVVVLTTCLITRPTLSLGPDPSYQPTTTTSHDGEHVSVPEPERSRPSRIMLH